MFKVNLIPSSPFPPLPLPLPPLPPPKKRVWVAKLLGRSLVLASSQSVSFSVEYSDTICLSALKVVVKICWTCLIGFQKCGIILMKSWKNIANRIPLLVSNLHQNASLMVNDYLEGFSHNEANIQAIGISKKSILLCSRKGKKILNCSYDSGRNSLKIDIFGPGHTLCWYFSDKHLEQELLFHIIFSLIMFANVFPPSLRLSKNLRKRKNIESTLSSLRNKR